MNRSFIILSSGRSGSSMLRQLLSCHPSIFCHARNRWRESVHVLSTHQKIIIYTELTDRRQNLCAKSSHSYIWIPLWKHLRHLWSRILSLWVKKSATIKKLWTSYGHLTSLQNLPPIGFKNACNHHKPGFSWTVQENVNCLWLSFFLYMQTLHESKKWSICAINYCSAVILNTQ